MPSLSEVEKGRKDTGRNVLPAGRNGEAETSCKIATLKESLLWMLWNLKDQSKKSARNMSYKKTCMHWLQSLNVSNQQREIF